MGVRAVAIITEPFQRTAEAMARRMGMAKAPWVVAPHPVSSLSAEGVRVLARNLAPQVHALLQAMEHGDFWTGRESGDTSDGMGAK